MRTRQPRSSTDQAWKTRLLSRRLTGRDRNSPAIIENHRVDDLAALQASIPVEAEGFANLMKIADLFQHHQSVTPMTGHDEPPSARGAFSLLLRVIIPADMKAFCKAPHRSAEKKILCVEMPPSPCPLPQDGGEDKGEGASDGVFS